MFEGFVHPALAAGAALAAVPLLIHLLNRQRHRPLRWAAMSFVLAAYRRTRRRVQFENLLLLLLRMGAVALIALAVARPFASGEGALGPLTEKRRDVVLVLDASASTGYREEVETVYERIVERAGVLVAALDGAGGDRVNLIVAGAWPRVMGWSDPEKAKSVLPTLTQPTDEALDLAVTLAEVQALAEADAAGTGTSSLEVRLLTDLQRSTFSGLTQPALPAQDGDAPEPDGDEDADGREAPLLAEVLDALGELGLTVAVEDLGPTPTRPPNLSLIDVLPITPLVGSGGRVEVAVRLANHGDAPRPAERVSLTVDGNKLPVQRVDVGPRATAEAVFSVGIDAPGPHSLVAELDGDRLIVDDRRATVVIAPPPVRVLVVNGAPADDLDEDEVGYLMLALEPLDADGPPGGALLSPFEAREVTPDALVSPDLDLRQFDVLVLANVPPLPDVVVEALEERVAAGAALVLALGDRIGDLATVNRKLFRPDGSGLLPAELVARVASARRESYYRVKDFDDEHPALSFFADEAWKPLLTEVPVYEFVRARPVEGAVVLAHLDDDSESPLLVTRAWDRGSVHLWTTSLSRAWTDVPASPKTLIPLVHEWLRHAGSRPEPPRVVRPGESVALVVDDFPRGPELVRSDASRRSLDGPVEEAPDGRWRLPVIGGDETQRAGLYAVAMEDGEREPFAVQIDAAEGDLERVAPHELAGVHPALELSERGESATGAADDGPQRGEIWRSLALAALLFLVAESLWGAWLGLRRRVAS